jgi:nitrite reductase (NADH) small subunit
MSAWIEIGLLDDLPLRGSRCVNTPQGKIGLFRVADSRVFAIRNECPHKSGPLTEGIVHGTSVTCPLHNWVISLETGLAQGADEGAVATIPVMVENGRMLILRAAVAATAAA